MVEDTYIRSRIDDCRGRWRGNRFPSLEISIDLSLFSFTSFVHRSLSASRNTERPAPLVPSLGRVASPLSRFMDVEPLSLRRGSFIAFHFRDEFARPIGAWQKCNATTEVRGHRIVCVRQEKQGLPSSSRVASRVSPRWRRENIYWMLSHTSGHVLVTVLHRSPYEIGSLLKWILCGRVVAAILDPLATR